MNVIEVLQGMLDRYNRKRELHQRAHTMFKNRDMKIFTVPLMAVQFLCAILPQISEAIPTMVGLKKVISILSSALAAMSAIWLGFQGKKRYGERSESHKNAASIFQHMAVLTMVEKQRAKMNNDNDLNKLFIFQDMMQNLEGKAKDDENLVPARISQAVKREKEIAKGKAAESEREKMIKPEENPEEIPLSLPAILHEPASASVPASRLVA